MNATQQRPVTALLSAAETVVEAGQQAMLDRFELIRTEAMDEARQMLIDASLLAAATSLAAFGYILLAIAAVMLLAQFVAPWLASAVIAVPHLVVGIGLAAYAASRFKREVHMMSSTISDTVSLRESTHA